MNHQSKHHDVSNKFENEYSSKLVRGLPETIQSPTILILLKSFLFCLFCAFFNKKTLFPRKNHPLIYRTTKINNMSFIQEILQPGGGVMLIPFVRVVISVLLVLTIMGFVANVARIHMVILGFLATGLLLSLSMFEREFNKVTNKGPTATAGASKIDNNKTD